MITEKDILDFIGYAHKVGQAGLTVCSSGNLSVRYGDEVLVSGTGSWVPELTADKVSIVKLADGEIQNGVRPSMESTFHLGVMRQRQDVGCVLHFQSPYATAIACRKDIPSDFNLTAECPIHVGREIPFIPYYRPGSPELAKAVIEAMKEHNSVMLRKHGQVVCGANFQQAFERAMFFEMACRILVLNQGNVDPLTNEEIRDLDVYILGKK